MGVYLEDLTYKEILPILARTGKLIDTRKIIEIDDEAIDIAQDIIDGCKELKERINTDLVRCGECKWCDDKGKGRALICTNPCIDMDIHPLDFCSYGERR